MYDFDEETLQDFVVETEENLQIFEENFLLLDGEPENREAVDEAFRSIHSIKGIANYLGLEKIAGLTHRMETLLDRVRAGRNRVDISLIELQLAAKDVLVALIRALVENREADIDISEIMSKLEGASSEERRDDFQEPEAETVTVAAPVEEKEKEEEKETFVDVDEDEESLEPCQEVIPVPHEEVPFSVPSDVHILDAFEEFNLSDDVCIDLLKIPGVGKVKTIALKEAGFFTIGELRRANKEELMKVKGINELTAELILAEVSPFVSLDEIAAAEPSLPSELPEADAGRLPSEQEHSAYDEVLINEDDLKPEISQLPPVPASLTEDESPPEIPAEPASQDMGDIEAIIESITPHLDNISDNLNRLESNPDQRVIIETLEEQITSLTASIENKGLSDASGILERITDMIREFTPNDLVPLLSEYHLLRIMLLESVPREDNDEREDKEDEAREREDLLPIEAGPEEEPAAVIPPSDEQKKSSGEMSVDETRFTPPKPVTSRQTLRVDTEKVDNLIASVGELVVNRSTFGQISNHFRDAERILKETSHIEKRELRFLRDTRMRMEQAVLGLGRVVNELQGNVMRVRMVPVKEIFNRFPRLVRTLSKEMDKEINIDISGGETELDKNVTEEIYHPLVHLMRNAIDHGIESPGERMKSGKAVKGHIELSARHEGDKVIIDVRDDGKGIDAEMIKRRAIEKNIISKTEAAILTHKEVLNLIFHPGFSTTDKVNDISGRGVGMDVVKKNVDKLKGSIEIESEVGEYTRFSIILPLTLAIIQALLVKVEDEIYCIPLTSVIETERTKEKDIETIENTEVIRLRDKVTPLLRLSDIFNVSQQNRNKEDQFFVVVVNDGTKETGLVVDSLVGESSIVIKPFEETYMETHGISGATIMGDGRVSLILDVPALIQYAIERKRTVRVMHQHSEPVISTMPVQSL